MEKYIEFFKSLLNILISDQTLCQWARVCRTINKVAEAYDENGSVSDTLVPDCDQDFSSRRFYTYRMLLVTSAANMVVAHMKMTLAIAKVYVSRMRSSPIDSTHEIIDAFIANEVKTPDPQLLLRPCYFCSFQTATAERYQDPGLRASGPPHTTSSCCDRYQTACRR